MSERGRERRLHTHSSVKFHHRISGLSFFHLTGLCRELRLDTYNLSHTRTHTERDTHSHIHEHTHTHTERHTQSHT